MKSTTTKSANWIKYCQEWALARQPFHLFDVDISHLQFCEIFCAQNQYKFEYSEVDSIVSFLPE